MGTVVPLLISLAVALQNFSYPTAVDRAYWTDHVSHMGATLMFLKAGFDVYRKPVNAILTPASPQSIPPLGADQMPEMRFMNPLNASAPAILINAPGHVRPYPPGVYVLFLPVALLYHFRLISFVWACRIPILGLLAAAAAVSYILWSTALAATNAGALAIQSVNAAMVTFWCHLWALRGQYDVVAFLLVVLSLTSLRKRAWIDAIFYFALAAFLHSRALYASPIVLIALFGALREDRACLSRWLREPKIWIAFAAAAVCLTSVVITLPHVMTWNSNNIYRSVPHGLVDLSFARAVGFSLAGILAAALLWSKDIGGLLMLLCPWVFMLRTPEVQLWHSMFWLPFLLYCSFNLRTAGRQFIWFLSLLMISYLTWVVYGVAQWLGP